MALINCPVCSKEVSEMASNCPNCGHPIKKAKTVLRKSKKLAIIVICVALLGVAGAFVGYTIYQNISERNHELEMQRIEEERIARGMLYAQPVEELIDAIGAVTLQSERQIHLAQEAYYGLEEAYREFVSNYDILLNAITTFEALPTPLTTHNISRYVNMNLSFSDLEDTSFTAQGLFFGGGRCSMLIEIQPIQELFYDNVVIELRVNFDIIGSFGWEAENATIRLSDSGSGRHTATIRFDNLISRPSLPIASLEVVSVRGNVYRTRP